LILVGLATGFDWRVAFFMAGIPGLLAAAAIGLFVKEDRASPGALTEAAAEAPSRLRDILRVRNIWLSAAISSLVLGFILTTAIFLPLYLVQVRHLSPIEMGLVMTGGGVAALVGGFGVPAVSDHIGRKPVIAAFGLVGATLPIVCILGAVPVAVLACLYAAVSLAFALPNLTIMTVSAESVGLRDRGAALGLVQGVAEIVGGFSAPALVGIVADQTSLAAAPLIAGACALGVTLLSLLLTETAPSKLPASAVLAAA
jgi:predicted MFS family arabinose efflux permease